MNDYRTYVQAIARAGDGHTILNRSPAHASIIVAAVFGTTQRLIEILTSNLRDDIYGTQEVIDAAVAFLTRNPEANIQIITVDGLRTEDSRFLTALQNHRLVNDRAFIGRCNDSQACAHLFRFLVGDGQHYRFQQDPDNTEAIVQFGRNETGRKLHEIFLALAEQVDLAPLSRTIPAPTHAVA